MRQTGDTVTYPGSATYARARARVCVCVHTRLNTCVHRWACTHTSLRNEVKKARRDLRKKNQQEGKKVAYLKQRRKTTLEACEAFDEVSFKLRRLK